ITGRTPPIAMPIAVPAIPDSANGVSKHRSSPNCWLRPSVILNTPPSVPTSSPKTTTMSLADISSARAALSAAAKVRVDFSLLMPGSLGALVVGVGIAGKFFGQLGALLCQLWGLHRVDVIKQIQGLNIG